MSRKTRCIFAKNTNYLSHFLWITGHFVRRQRGRGIWLFAASISETCLEIWKEALCSVLPAAWYSADLGLQSLGWLATAPLNTLLKPLDVIDREESPQFLVHSWGEPQELMVTAAYHLAEGRLPISFTKWSSSRFKRYI